MKNLRKEDYLNWILANFNFTKRDGQYEYVKSGIKILNDNLVKKYSNHVKNFFLNKGMNYSDSNSRTTSINEIVLKDEKKNYVIYPRYKSPNNKRGFYLKDLPCWINGWNVSQLETNYIESLEYVEIGNLQNNQIFGSFKKGKTSYRIAKKGDILLSSLTPSKQKVVLVEKDYKVSKAIHVLSFQNPIHREYVYKYLLENKNEIFSIFNSLLDGFKITYSKVSEFNLMNYVFFEGDIKVN